MEPITNPKNKRFCIFPIKYRNIYEHYENQLASFWQPSEIDFSKDRDDYEKMTENERHAIKSILAFFASSDGIVNFNIEKNLISQITIPEIILTYNYQKMMEDIHNISYSKMIDNIIRNDKEKEELFDAIHNIPVIKNITDWIIEYIENDKPLSHKLIAFMCIEGLLFSSAFAIVFWFKDKFKGTLNGLTKSNEFISRDEGQHYNFGLAVYKMIENKPSENDIINIITDCVEISYKLSEDAFKVDMLGINKKLMRQYIQYVADRVSYDLLNKKIYKSENPFSFMQSLGLKTKSNFFEQRETEYQLAFNSNYDNHDLELTDDF